MAMRVNGLCVVTAVLNSKCTTATPNGLRGVGVGGVHVGVVREVGPRVPLPHRLPLHIELPDVVHLQLVAGTPGGPQWQERTPRLTCQSGVDLAFQKETF